MLKSFSIIVDKTQKNYFEFKNFLISSSLVEEIKPNVLHTSCPLAVIYESKNFDVDIDFSNTESMQPIDKKSAIMQEIQNKSNNSYVVIKDNGYIYGSNASFSSLQFGGGNLLIIPSSEIKYDYIRLKRISILNEYNHDIYLSLSELADCILNYILLKEE